MKKKLTKAKLMAELWKIEEEKNNYEDKHGYDLHNCVMLELAHETQELLKHPDMKARDFYDVLGDAKNNLLSSYIEALDEADTELIEKLGS